MIPQLGAAHCPVTSDQIVDVYWARTDQFVMRDLALLSSAELERFHSIPDKAVAMSFAQNDLRMEVANNIAQAVAARVEAEQHLEQAKAAEKLAFNAALKKGWTQAELNKIGSPSRRQTRKKDSDANASSAD